MLPLRTPSYQELFCEEAAKTKTTWWIDLFSLTSGLGLLQSVECKQNLSAKNRLAEAMRKSPIWRQCHIQLASEEHQDTTLVRRVFLKTTANFTPIEGEIYTVFAAIQPHTVRLPYLQPYAPADTGIIRREQGPDIFALTELEVLLEGKAKGEADREEIIHAYQKFQSIRTDNPKPFDVSIGTSSLVMRPWSKDTFIIDREIVGTGSEKVISKALKVSVIAKNHFKVKLIALVTPKKRGFFSTLDCSFAIALNLHPCLNIPKQKNIRTERTVQNDEICTSTIWMEKLGLGDMYRNLDLIPSETVFYELCENLLEGLIYLHSQNKIHGDLKPTNFLLYRKEGTLYAKIADLNCCHERRENTSQFGVHTHTYLPFDRRRILLKGEKKFTPLYEIDSSVRTERRQKAIAAGFTFTETFQAEGISMGLSLAAMYFVLFQRIPISSTRLEKIIEGLVGYPLRDSSHTLYATFSDYINVIDRDLFQKTEEEVESIMLEERLSLSAALTNVKTLL